MNIVYIFYLCQPPDQFVTHFQISAPPNEDMDIARPLVALPSVIMLATSSRIVVFWIVNIVLIFIVARLARRSLYKHNDDDSSSIGSLPVGLNQNNNHYPRTPKQDSTQMQELAAPENNDSYVETVIVSNNYVGHNLAANQQVCKFD